MKKMTRDEYIHWAVSSRENLDKVCSDMMNVCKNNPKISNFNECFEELCYMYGWKWKIPENFMEVNKI
mgnify:CR=1 FL=1